MHYSSQGELHFFHYGTEFIVSTLTDVQTSADVFAIDG